MKPTEGISPSVLFREQQRPVRFWFSALVIAIFGGLTNGLYYWKRRNP